MFLPDFLARLDTDHSSPLSISLPGSMLTTHPATAMRLETLRERLPEAIALYDSTGCAPLRNALRRVYGVV